MSVLFNRRLVLSALVVGVLLVGSQPAQAGFAIKIGSTVINDGDPLDLSSAPGAITVLIGSGPNEVNIPGMTGLVVGAITNSPGDSTGGLLDINYSLQSASGSSSVTIYASANNFTLPSQASNPLVLDLNLATNGTGMFSTTASAYADALNSFPFNTSTSPSVSVGPATNSNYKTSNFDSQSPFTRGAGAYSLTEKMTVMLGPAASTTSGDLQLTVTPMAVPVPGGFLLVLTGAPCLAAGSWLRRRFPKKA